MKYCEYCGRQLKEDSSFCGACGNSSKETNVQSPQDNQQLQNSQNQQLQNNQNHPLQHNQYQQVSHSYPQNNYHAGQGIVSNTNVRTVNNTVVWFIAFMPIIGSIIEGVVGAALHEPVGNFWWITVVCNIILCSIDLSLINEIYPGMSIIKAWVWLVPVYLYRRAKILKQNLSYFTVWLVAFALLLVIPFILPTVPGSYAAINTVKNGYFNDYPYEYIGETIDKRFDGESWNSFTTPKGAVIVEVTGSIEGYQIKMQFTVHGNEFYQTYVEFDGEPQSSGEIEAINEIIFGE